MRQPKSPRDTRPRTSRVPLSRRTLDRLILLGNFAAIALVIGTAIHIARNSSPPPIDYCPPHDRANPWCSAHE